MRKKIKSLCSFIAFVSVAMLAGDISRISEIRQLKTGPIGPVATQQVVEIKKEQYRRPSVPDAPEAVVFVEKKVIVKKTQKPSINNNELKQQIEHFAVASAQQSGLVTIDEVKTQQAVVKVEFSTVEKKVIIQKEEISIPADVAVEMSTQKLDKENIEITVGEKIELSAIEVVPTQSVSLVALYQPILIEEEELAVSVKDVLIAQKKEEEMDRISTAQAAPEKSTKSNKEVESKELNSNANSKEVEMPAIVEQIDLSAVKQSQVNTQKAPLAQQSAPVETKPEKKEEIKKSDELVFFDYSAKAEQKPAELTQVQAMEALIKAEKKESKKTKKTVAKKTSQKSQAEEVNGFADEYSCSVENKSTKATYDYSFELMRVDGVNRFGKVSSYEFDFKDDYNDRINSDSQGRINLKGKTSLVNTRRFSIYSRDTYPTLMDQEIRAGIAKVKIPVFSNNYFAKLLENNQLRGLGGQVIVELDEITEDVELDLDIRYEKKLYLDRQFKVVQKADSEYDYILFVGVRAGNAIVNFRTYNNEVTSKIIHVTNAEMFYEPNFYNEEKKDNFKLCEEHVLSRKILPLDLDVKKIQQFSQNSKVMKNAIGEFYYPRTLYPSSTRKYLELSHLNDSIFVGYSNNRTIVVPSENYISVVMQKMGLSDLKNQCIIQLNLSDKVRNLSMEGHSFRGPMKLDSVMLDEDGVFYEEFTSTTKRVFIHGEEQGIVNLKLEYNDGSYGYIQTYCSNNTYLVEQL